MATLQFPSVVIVLDLFASVHMTPSTKEEVQIVFKSEVLGLMPVIVTFKYVILVRLLNLLMPQLLYVKWGCVLRIIHLPQVCFENTVLKYVRFLEQRWKHRKCCMSYYCHSEYLFFHVH